MDGESPADVLAVQACRDGKCQHKDAYGGTKSDLTIDSNMICWISTDLAAVNRQYQTNTYLLTIESSQLLQRTLRFGITMSRLACIAAHNVGDCTLAVASVTPAAVAAAAILCSCKGYDSEEAVRITNVKSL